MQWLIANFPALLGIIGAILGVVVMVLQVAHKDAVAATVKAIQDDIAKLQGK